MSRRTQNILHEPHRIVALLPNWIGDVVMATPALRALHKRFPQARLAVVGRSSACGIVRGLPYIEALFELTPRPNLRRMAELAPGIRAAGRDLAVVFPHSFRAGLLAWLAGSRRRVGYDRDGRGFLLTDRIEPYREGGRIAPIYMADEYLELVRALGAEDDKQGLELHADPQSVKGVRRCFTHVGPRIGFAPGAAFGPSKRWPVERYAAVADALYEQTGAVSVLLTGPGEEDTREAFVAAASAPVTICDQADPSIDTLKATVSQLDLLICNDSGPRHVAVAFKVPTVCIMGPTSPRYSCGPYEKGEVLRVDVDCGPCQEPVCDTDHRCMTRITPERVVEAALRQLPGRLLRAHGKG